MAAVGVLSESQLLETVRKGIVMKSGWIARVNRVYDYVECELPKEIGRSDETEVLTLQNVYNIGSQFLASIFAVIKLY